MANATVEKLKTFGLRHGEKVGVGLVAALCVLLLSWAFSHPRLEVSPQDVKKAADAASQNLSRPQKEEDILKKLEDEKLVDPGFEKIVEQRKPGESDASKFRLANTFTAPEPGAGLIRDMPELVAVTRLLAHAGRGAVEVFETDEEGNRIPEQTAEEPDKTKTPKKAAPRRASANAMAGMMGGGMGRGMGGRGAIGGGASKKAGGPSSEEEKAKREEQRKAEREGRMVAGGQGELEDPAKKKAAEDSGEILGGKKAVRGYRWVAVTGVLDHKKLRENFAKALKIDFASAYPHYLRLDVQRQRRRDDGRWTDWAPVDRAYNKETVLSNITTREPDNPNVPPETQIPALVDHLPFLKVGYYAGVFHAAVYRRQEAAGKTARAASEPGFARPRGGLGPGGTGRSGSEMAGAYMKGGSQYDQMLKGRAGGGGGGGGMGGQMGGMMGRMMMGGGSLGGGAGGGGGDVPAEVRSDADRLMVRSLDFTAKPDATYRYRVRLVVQNPNYHVESVAPGVDNQSKELAGPWSDPSDVVAVPPDVSAYVLRKTPVGGNQARSDLITWEVVRWDDKTGQTIVATFDEAPGDIVGAVKGLSVPNPEKGGTTSAQVDFTSRRVVVDVDGGDRSLEALGLGTGRIVAPAQAVVLDDKGRIVLHDEARDVANGEAKEMEEIFKQSLADAKAGKEKKTSTLGGMAGMGGGATMMGSD